MPSNRSPTEAQVNQEEVKNRINGRKLSRSACCLELIEVRFYAISSVSVVGPPKALHFSHKMIDHVMSEPKNPHKANLPE